MPTKSELLEEKTVKELKQMARDQDLSGYSGMAKAELVDLVSAGYTKAEIKSWPEAEEEEGEEIIEEAEPVPEEEFGEEETKEVVEEAEPVEVTSIEEEFKKAAEPAPEEEPEEEFPTGILIGVGIAIIIIIIVVAALTLL